MDVVHERAAGIDISKRDAKVAVRVPGKRAGSYTTTVKTFGATTAQVLALSDYLLAQRVTTVVMEATSDYWKPFYYVMEDKLPVMLVNAKHARNIPGRKTDVSDAAWLAQLGAHGLLRASFIPPEPVRHLRDLTRARSMAARDRVRIVQRLEKFLESSGVKLSAVATDLTGVSARAMLEALVTGERDPKVLADLAKRTLRHKIPALIEALQGRFTEHHAFMVSRYLAQLDTQQATIDALTARIETVIAPFAAARQALVTMPGISQTVADVIIAETGAEMTVFPTAAQLASWAGVCPGLNESAGRVKSAHTRHGNAHLKAALGVAAMSASRTRNTYLAARYRRIATRRGPVRAVVAIERTILTAAWNMLTHHTTYAELGGDYYTRRDPMRAKHKAIRQLEALGYQVIVQPAIP
jgi:transposase